LEHSGSTWGNLGDIGCVLGSTFGPQIAENGPKREPKGSQKPQGDPNSTPSRGQIEAEWSEKRAPTMEAFAYRFLNDFRIVPGTPDPRFGCTGPVFGEGRAFFVGTPEQTRKRAKITRKSSQNQARSPRKGGPSAPETPEDAPKADRRRAKILAWHFWRSWGRLGAV
jgi:hypothetical protein